MPDVILFLVAGVMVGACIIAAAIVIIGLSKGLKR